MERQTKTSNPLEYGWTVRKKAESLAWTILIPLLALTVIFFLLFGRLTPVSPAVTPAAPATPPSPTSMPSAVTPGG